MVIGGGDSQIWELSSVSFDVSTGYLLVCDKMQLQVLYDRSMQLAAGGMCLEEQSVNAIPQQLHWKMALIYSNPHFYFFSDAAVLLLRKENFPTVYHRVY
jgi:hypothetical protein